MKKLLQNGLVKGLLVAFVCCVLLGSGAFVGKALAEVKGIFNVYICVGAADIDSTTNVTLEEAKSWVITCQEWPSPIPQKLIDELDAKAKKLPANDSDRVILPYTYGSYGQVFVEIECVEPYSNYTSETPSAASLKDSVVALNTAYLMSINNLSKRMGDLRGGEASNIPWVRFSRNNNTMGSLGYHGNTYQIGYDGEIARDKRSRQLLGISLDINDGTTKLTNGSGSMDGISVGVYYTKIYKSGHYFDFILRHGRFTDEVEAYDSMAAKPYTAFDYGINATTLSGEYGYRWKLGKSGFYIEPQAELIYGRLSSANITTSNNESFKLESNNKFISRLGLAFGKRKNSINYYARVSQFYDWGSAKSTVVQDGTASSVDLAKNWWEVSLGGGWHINNVSYFYTEISKQYKDIQNSLNFNVGFRFALGGCGVHIPTDEDAMQEYLRMRNEHNDALKKIKTEIYTLCLKHGFRYEGAKWTQEHLEWIKNLKIENAVYKETIDEYVASFEELKAKIERFDKRIQEISELQKYQKKVKRL